MTDSSPRAAVLVVAWYMIVPFVVPQDRDGTTVRPTPGRGIGRTP